MIFIIGGAYQGKLEFARQKFQLSDRDIYTCGSRGGRGELFYESRDSRDGFFVKGRDGGDDFFCESKDSGSDFGIDFSYRCIDHLERFVYLLQNGTGQGAAVFPNNDGISHEAGISEYGGKKQREFAMTGSGNKEREISAVDGENEQRRISAVEYFKAHREEWRDCILLCEDIHCGVVPLGARMRAWRDETGRLCQYLAEQADAVYRLFCGLPQQLKLEHQRK